MSKKNQVFFKKKFEPFEKSYYFSRILRQICYNLLIKSFQTQKVSQHRTLSIGIHWVKKNVRVERMIFSYIINMAEKQKAATRVKKITS